MSSTHGPRRPKPSPTATFGPFVQGLIAAVALGSLASTGGGSVTGVVPVAIGMGVAAAVFAVSGAWLSGIAGWFYSALGGVAFLPAAVAFVRDNGCLPGPPPVLRVVGLVLLVAVAAVTFGAGLVAARRMPAPAIGAALFGGLQILIAAATFIAGADTSVNALALAVMVPGAAVCGWLVVTAGDAVAGVGGVAFGMQSIYAASVGSACADANLSGVAVIVVFTGAYFVGRAVCAPFAGRQ